MSQGGATLGAGPAMLPAFQLAHPASVDVVGAEVTSGIDLREGRVDDVRQLGPRHGLLGSTR
ncbi:hypothetical protein EEZ25_27185 [Micromonospora aurantiaca]|nr:hypothetical protein EEZ25_27185 [Micromonospora aurantiaca]